jgi:hypothetical protein
MSYVTIDGNPELLASAFDDDLSEMLDEALRSNAYYYAEVLKEVTPKRTGETAESIGVEEDYLNYGVGTDSPVFAWLDEGTEGHGPIIPRTAQALHWVDEAGEHFAKYVLWVSGIEPMNLFETALEIAEPAMDLNLEQYMDMAFDKAASEAYGVEGGD